MHPPGGSDDHATLPSRDTGAGAGTALPDRWADQWGHPSPFLRKQLSEMRASYENLAAGIPLRDMRGSLGALVGSTQLRDAPIHRWFTYKEGFSPRLPGRVASLVGVGGGTVGDPFAGVATTALSLGTHPRVSSVRGVEYSPLAHFVGETKLAWPRLSPNRLRRLTGELSSYPVDRSLTPPELAAFANDEIFEESSLTSLLSAREQIRTAEMRPTERAFFLLGLAAVTEPVSGAMKDGRALRILRGRRRGPSSLTPRDGACGHRDNVRSALTNQWLAMSEDLVESKALRERYRETDTAHLRGDARELAAVRVSPRRAAFEAGSVGLFLFSPPYLNFIDYSEIYKLELWLLEFVQTQAEFRDLRLGTLRSHPSVEFPDRGYSTAIDESAVTLIDQIADFLARHGVRSGVARIVRQYFDDMFRVFAQQAAALEPGGHSVCVVANSNLSRRVKESDGVDELWRIPILTDVLLARLAQAAGLEDIEIWTARELRPRNVRSGAARESLVVARKPAA